MSPQREIRNTRTNETVLARAKYCAGFFSRLLGLQFSSKQSVCEGALFCCRTQDRLSATIHTIGMRSSIGVIWLDSMLVVVDARLAKPGRLAHVPRTAAMYYLEADPSILQRVRIGDQLRIDEVSA